MWYEDLSEFTNFGKKISKIICGENYSEILIAVGWLENGKSYNTGEVPQGVCEKISEFIKVPEMCLATLGKHQCDFCNFKFIDGFGSITFFIASKNKIFVCPDLIVHYIENHNYLPPAEFTEFILACTLQESKKYFKKFNEKGLPKIK